MGMVTMGKLPTVEIDHVDGRRRLVMHLMCFRSPAADELLEAEGDEELQRIFNKAKGKG